MDAAEQMSVADAVRESYCAQWGKPTRTRRFEDGGLAVQVLKWDARASAPGVVLYATVGASSRPLAGQPSYRRVEFFAGLRPARDGIDGALAALAIYSARRGIALDHGHTVPSERSLWPGSDMSAFLLVRARPDFVPMVVPDDLQIDLLQAIPIYESERAFKRTNGIDKLLNLWSQARVPLWDPTRKANPDWPWIGEKGPAEGDAVAVAPGGDEAS